MAPEKTRPSILFIQGAGVGAYVEDRLLVSSLQEELRGAYNVRYPRMPQEDDPAYLAWKAQIDAELAALGAGAVLVAHSAGGPTLLRYLSEATLPGPIAGLFLIAPPYVGAGGWEVDGWDVGEIVRRERFASQVTEAAPVFFYHSRDDEVVPFDHLALFRARLPQATFRILEDRGHQLGNDLTEVAQDILNV